LSFLQGVGESANRRLNLGEPEEETGQKPTSNPNPAERRNSLFAYLGHAIRLSHEKMSSIIMWESQDEKDSKWIVPKTCLSAHYVVGRFRRTLLIKQGN
jgi:hypothetical protein